MNILAKTGKLLFTLLVIATLSGIVYYNRENYIPVYEEARLFVGLDKPCSKPITYYIGDFDQRFGQSREEFEKNLSKAAGIWNNASGKTLFQYSPTNPDISDLSKNKLRVNLIYDDRQEITNKLKTVGSAIEENQNVYESQKASFDLLKSKYESQKKALDSLSSSYDNLKSSYEKEVAYWNSKGGAPKKEYAELEKTRMELNSLASRINEANKDINQTIAELNSLVNTLNSLGSDINQKIGNFNTISNTNGPEFEEGEYISDQFGRRINIYEYGSYTKLIRVLGHEFGHALGIDHVDDKEALMYAYNTNPEIKLASSDIKALTDVCGPN